MEIDLFKLQHSLSEMLTEKRFYHSLGVQATSFAMAARYDYDLNKASLAGLLHDCAKCLTDDQLLYYCETNHIIVRDVERSIPYLLHGKLGAFYAEHKYSIKDADVLSAITYHTTGKSDMTLLEKIVFTADFIEPGRSDKRIPNLNQIRKIAFNNLDLAVYRILESTLTYLKNENQKIDTLTVEAHAFYKEKIAPQERGLE